MAYRPLPVFIGSSGTALESTVDLRLLLAFCTDFEDMIVEDVTLSLYARHDGRAYSRGTWFC
jgi:hypothetical protein